MMHSPISHPLGEQHFPAESRAALRAALTEQVTTPASRTARRHWVVIPAVTAGVMVGGAIGGVAYGALTSNAPVTDQNTARCYSSAHYRADSNSFPGTTIGVPDSASGQGAVSNALDTCGALWRAGILQPGIDTAVVSPGQDQYPVPDLVECVLPDGRAAVFPGVAGLCAQLGLQTAITGMGR